MKVIEDATVPGAYLVDFIPSRNFFGLTLIALGLILFSVKYLPSWLPFIKFHDDAKRGREQIANFVARPFEHVKREMVCQPLLYMTIVAAED